MQQEIPLLHSRRAELRGAGSEARQRGELRAMHRSAPHEQIPAADSLPSKQQKARCPQPLPARHIPVLAALLALWMHLHQPGPRVLARGALYEAGGALRNYVGRRYLPKKVQAPLDHLHSQRKRAEHTSEHGPFP